MYNVNDTLNRKFTFGDHYFKTDQIVQNNLKFFSQFTRCIIDYTPVVRLRVHFGFGYF